LEHEAPWRAIAAWIGFVVVALVLGAAAGSGPKGA
jgi:hypothetical protein